MSKPEMSLQEILDRSKDGDQQAFRQLVERYQAMVYGLAMRFVGDESEAEDVVQESFVRVWRHLHSFRTGGRFSTWLYRIVTRLCLDHLKAARRRRLIFAFPWIEVERLGEEMDGGDPGAEAQWHELLQVVRHMAATLPRKQATVFILRDLQDLTIEETAMVVGLSPGSVKSNLHHARVRLRRQLQRYYSTEDLPR